MQFKCTYCILLCTVDTLADLGGATGVHPTVSIFFILLTNSMAHLSNTNSLCSHLLLFPLMFAPLNVNSTRKKNQWYLLSCRSNHNRRLKCGHSVWTGHTSWIRHWDLQLIKPVRPRQSCSHTVIILCNKIDFYSIFVFVSEYLKSCSYWAIAFAIHYFHRRQW